MTSSIEFQIPNSTINESDGSVIINLVRTGNHSISITVYIAITMDEDPAVSQCMEKLSIISVLYLHLNFNCLLNITIEKRSLSYL